MKKKDKREANRRDKKRNRKDLKRKNRNKE